MNFKKFLSLLIIFTCLTIAFAQKSTNKDYSYPVGPKDLLTISVFDVPELNITVRVSEDGTITLPLLGQIEVDGLTLAELEHKLATLLEKSYLKNAQVTVFIKEYQSKQVSVIGAVKKPGNYELKGKQTLLQVLSLAGGLTEEASDRIVVIRQYSDGTNKSIIIDIEDLMIKGNQDQNVPILSDDIINVPIEMFADIYIFGQVNNAGQIKMKKSSSFTLLRAIAQAGGFTERARRSGVVIKRMVNNKEVKMQVNVNKILSGKKKDIVLNPNDIVFIPESIL